MDESSSMSGIDGIGDLLTDAGLELLECLRFSHCQDLRQGACPARGEIFWWDRAEFGPHSGDGAAIVLESFPRLLITNAVYDDYAHLGAATWAVLHCVFRHLRSPDC